MATEKTEPTIKVHIVASMDVQFSQTHDIPLSTCRRYEEALAKYRAESPPSPAAKCALDKIERDIAEQCLDLQETAGEGEFEDIEIEEATPPRGRSR